jgi:hypothetical protein
MEPPAAPGYYERLAQPTFTINSLTCEDAGEHRTVIPSVAVANCDVRLVGGQRASPAMDAIRRHVAVHAPGVERALSATARVAGVCSPHDPVLRAVARGYEAWTPACARARGSLPLAALLEELGVPCYGIPLANVDESNHAPNENLELNWFLRGIAAAGPVSALSQRTRRLTVRRAAGTDVRLRPASGVAPHPDGERLAYLSDAPGARSRGCGTSAARVSPVTCPSTAR